VKVYVAGQLADKTAVADAQRAVLAAGHELTHDWAQDLEFTIDSASRPEELAHIAQTDLTGVMAADAVVVHCVKSSAWTRTLRGTRRGARAGRDGLLRHVVAVGTIVHESVFYFHPRVRRVATVREWLAEVESHAAG
jgi:hypothetical protein